MKKLVLKIACSPQERERCTQAFNVAASALAAGAQVNLWLAGDAVKFAIPEFAESQELEHSMSLAELRDSVLALGQMYACTQCLARRNLTSQDLLDGVEVAGAATFTEQILDEDVQALVY